MEFSDLKIKSLGDCQTGLINQEPMAKGLNKPLAVGRANTPMSSIFSQTNRLIFFLKETGMFGLLKCQVPEQLFQFLPIRQIRQNRI